MIGRYEIYRNGKFLETMLGDGEDGVIKCYCTRNNISDSTGFRACLKTYR